MKRLVLLLLILCATPWLTGQMVVSSLSSPVFASGEGGTSSQEAPFSDRFNPASSAYKQRTTFDFSYLGLPGPNGYGNAVNLGLTLPQTWAVLSATASYWGLDVKDFDLGHQGQLTFSASKDLFEDLYIGAQLGTQFGTGGWGAGLSLGFQHFPGTLNPWMQDLRWGAALRDMGTAYTTKSGNAIPPVFTPAIGADFFVLKTNGLAIELRPDLSAPSFQDLRFSLGSTIAFGDVLALNLAYNFDLRDTFFTKTAPAVPLSAGVSFTFKTDLQDNVDLLDFSKRGWNKSEVHVTTSAMPLSGGVWAFGGGVNIPLGQKDTLAPVVAIDTSLHFISPNNDGVQDTLDLPVTISDERFITSYRIAVYDVKKALVRSIQSALPLPQAEGFDQILNRLAYVKHGVTIPPTLSWNGYSDAGTVVPDGTYTLVLTARDDNGNQKDWPSGSVVVKNTPPLANLSAPVSEFNPVGPRNRLALVQRGTAEDQWTGIVRDSRDQIVRQVTWAQSAPANFEWDGKNDAGKLVPDGVYTYELSATDPAGNKATSKISNILVNSQPTPLDLNLNRMALSPDGNGAKTLVFQPKPGLSAGMTSWKVEILDTKGNTYKTLRGTGVIPPEIAYDGHNEANQSLPEGDYRAKLTLEYSNGNAPEVLSPPFTVKNSPPQAKVSSPFTVFSPGSVDGHGVLTFQQTTSAEELWTGKLTNASGDVLRMVRWTGKADATFVWDGLGSDGKILPDGNYVYSIEAVDKAGNRGSSTPLPVTVDTKKREVLITADRSALSPGSLTANGRVKFLPLVKETTGLQNFSLVLRNAFNQVVLTWPDQTSVPASVDWDGKLDNGAWAPDGVYVAEIKTTYSNGNTPGARSNPVLVKNGQPTLTLSSDTTVFSPTPGSSRPVLNIIQDSSSEKEWTAALTRGTDTIKTWSWQKGRVTNIAWDGTDANGNHVADGTYRYEVKTTDEAGNSLVKSLESLTVDSRPTPLFLTTSADGFSPNGDGSADTLTLSPKLGVSDGISTWKISVEHESLGLRKVFSGTGTVPAQLVWDGSADDKRKAEDGRYTAKLEVAYAKGNAPETRSSAFVLQAGPPQVALDIGPQPFSPDNDGTNDELLIALAVKSYAPVADWSLDITDPESHRFIRFTGKGAPASQFKWDGRSDTGELVQSASDYTIRLQVRDTLGNIGTIQKPLAVDVLVIRDGDRLRIIIPSITFAANSSDFIKGIEADKVTKNQSVLKRLAEIFTKYSRYKIGIEGHAVMINWDNKAKGDKEQETELLPLSKTRAEAVKVYLSSLGIASSRITTSGIGGARPVVPFSDTDNRWKNRRVEFWLDRE
ncbi:MAG: FlgD immunoglobulin-like domain containing protein [Spirochaetales bacterium]